MKKIFLYIALASVSLAACRDDDDQRETVEEVAVAVQNGYDDEAAIKYLDTHYLDAKGNVKVFIEGDKVNVKLADLNPVTLPSGVIYVVRPGAQPDPATPIGNTDVISLMSNTTAYVATNTDNKVAYASPFGFKNTIAGMGVPEVDPAYYYVKTSVLKNATAPLAKERSYYEIEGFKEALQKFGAYNIPDSDNYNLQGVIIVPSRAAFARDPHFNYVGISLRNRSFIFNFQVYKSRERVMATED